jgi:hypothetical protein
MSNEVKSCELYNYSLKIIFSFLFSYFVLVSSFAQSFQPEFQTGNLPNILQTFSDREELRRQALMVVNFSTEKHYTAVHSVIINNNSSRTSRFGFIDSVQIGQWNYNPEKGKVRQTFKNAVLSGEKTKGIIPLEYQYEFETSPDKKHFLVYRYDYSQPVLYANLFLLDSALTVIYKTSLPVDDGSTVHSFHVLDSGEIIMLGSVADQNLDVFIINPKSEYPEVISLEANVLKRRSFRFFSAGGKTFSVANLCEDEAGNLEGVMVADFDMTKRKAASIIYHPFTDEFVNKITQSAQTGFYDIAEFSINEAHEIALTLEKRAILSTAYTYAPYQANDILLWKPRQQKVEKGNKISVEIFLGGRLVREEFVK